MKTALIQRLFIVFLFISSALFAQLETAQWRFGAGCGLDFTTNPPTNVSSLSYTGNTSIASVADANGNLLFYTNGVNVWTNTHTLMVNGTALLGNNYALIMKQPGSNSLYYIFYLNGSMAFSPTWGMYYAIVDMSLAGGFGAVVTKNINLYSGPIPSKITGTKHCNGSDYWVLIKDCYNTNNCMWNGHYNFFAYQLTASGVNTTAVVSSYTYAAPGPMSGSRTGQMKISPNGKKLAVGNYNFCSQYSNLAVSMEFYDFNNSTGQVSNFVNLLNAPGPGNGFFNIPCPGVEFSPDGSKLYGTLSDNHHYANGSLLQWDLCAGSASAIIASQNSLAVNSFSSVNGFSGLQLAPNGKIYVGPYGGPPSASVSPISVINNPNVLGSACNFSFYVQSVTPGFLLSFFPNFMSSQFFLANSVPSFSLSLASNTVGCQMIQFQTPLNVGATVGNCAANMYTLQSLTWDFGDPGSGSANTSTLNNPIHTFFSTGVRRIKLYFDFGCGAGSTILTQTINVVNPVFGNLIHSTTLACFGANTGTANFVGQQGTGFTYTLTNGSTTYSTVSVNNLSAGIWTSVVTHSLSGCQTSTMFSIQQPPALTVSISSPTICQNNTIAVNAGGGTSPLNYLWSNGNTASNGLGNLLGINTVTVSDANACKLISNFTVYANPNIVTSGTTICSGNSFTLNASGATNFTWSAGPIVSPFVSTSYSVVGETNGCYNDTAVWVMVNASPTVTTNSPFIVICRGHTTTLTASGASTYTWSNNNFVLSFVYSSSATGYFWLSVTGANVNTCTHTTSMLIRVDECFTGIDQTGLSDDTKIFPNPSFGEINIETEKATVYLLNTVGDVILKTEVIDKKQLLIETAGIYFLRIETQNVVSNIKVVVVR